MFMMVSIHSLKVLVNKCFDFRDTGLVDLWETSSILTRISPYEIRCLALVGSTLGSLLGLAGLRTWT